MNDNDINIRNNVRSPCIVNNIENGDPYTGLLDYYRPPPDGRKEYNGIFLPNNGSYHRFEVPEMAQEIINIDNQSRYGESEIISNYEPYGDIFS